MKIRLLSAIVATLLLSSTSGAQQLVGGAPIQSLPTPVLLDTTGMFIDRYARVGDDLFIAGQPTERALREMNKLGVTTVINLRMPQEMKRIGFDEPKLVAELGMKYVYIPMRGGKGEQAYSPQTLSRFAEAMKGADGKVLLHCTIAWRASHIWAAYLIQEHGSRMPMRWRTRARSTSWTTTAWTPAEASRSRCFWAGRWMDSARDTAAPPEQRQRPARILR